MCIDPCFQCILLRPLSGEAAVEILGFLQVFTSDIANRYSNQIRCYYSKRSRHNIVQVNLAGDVGDPPF